MAPSRRSRFEAATDEPITAANAMATRLSPATEKLVWSKAAGLCAMESCRKSLVLERGDDSAALVGEIAHIVAHSGRGPRSDAEPSGGNRDAEPNLVLLCPNHHTEIDRDPKAWTVQRLLGIKESHERWVRERLSVEQANSDPGPELVETVHSSVMRVATIPRYVYVAPTTINERDIKGMIDIEPNSPIALPYIVRGGNLLTFTRLTDQMNPFARSFQGTAEAHDARKWWLDPDLSNWYVTLLNRTLNKLTGRRGLNLDKDHHRYYFDPALDANGNPIARTVHYQPLNNPRSEKSVVWRPVRKKTGEARNYWTHLAVGLRFHRVTQTDWVLSVRPERRFTVDGWKLLVPKATGRRATRTKSHMYNYSLLGELQFWKEYLSAFQSHTILDFGGQSLVIDAELLSGNAKWPGVEGDVRPFENIARPMDLFSSHAYHEALDANRDPDVELEEWELKDFVALESNLDDDVLTDEP